MSDAPPSADAVPDTDRLFGPTRLVTAVVASRAAFPDGAAEVYLARADVVADAIVAGTLAAGPVLLVPRAGRVPSAVLAEVARLDPGRVLALGGPQAVPTQILRTVAGRRRTGRLAGATRVETAVAVSRHAFPRDAPEAYLARSDLLVDAVAAGSLTAGPVLLVPPAGRVPSEVVAEVERLDPGRVLALGGYRAVSQETLTRVAGGRPTARLEGPTRVATAVAVSRHAFPDGSDAAYLVAADALVDAVVAGSLAGGPLLPVPGCDPLPAVVRREIDRLRPRRILAVGGPTVLCSRVLVEAARLLPRDCGPAFVDDRGPASTAAPVVGTALAGDRLYVATRGLIPMVVAAFDLATDRVTATVELPTGKGSWAVGVTRDGVLVGTYRPAHVYRLDPTTLRARRVAVLDDEEYVYSLAVGPEGTAAMGTFPDGAVYAYRAPGPVREYGPAVAGQYIVRSLAVTTDTIYAGVGSQAHLVAIDRRTGDRRGILPPTLADESFVYALARTSQWLVAGTEPSGRVAVMPVDDLADHRVLPALGERTVDAIAVDGDTVWFTGRTTGGLYRYVIGSESPRQMAVPLEREETRGLFVHGGVVLGIGGTGVVWRYDPATGTVTTTDLIDRGLPGGPEPVQSLAVGDSRVYVGGHWAVQIHPVGDGAGERIRVPGEPKAMADVGGVLYMAIDPAAEVWRHPGAAGVPEPVADIGHEQARPRGMAVQPGSGRVLVVSQADYGRRGGALSVFDPATGELAVQRNVIAQHGLYAVAADGDTAYVGSELGSGGGLPPVRGSARVAAWSIDGHRKVWEIEPVVGATVILALVAAHGLVYGLTAEGVLFSVNPRTGTVVTTARHTRGGRGLAMQNGLLYAAMRDGLHRIDLDSLAPSPIVPGRDLTHLAAAPRCTLFVVGGTHLLHVNPAAS